MKQIRLCVAIVVIAFSACSQDNNQSTAPPATTTAAPAQSEVTGTVPANAVVTLLPANEPPPMPIEAALMDQISKQFIPNVLITRVGQKVRFHNGEDLPHNVTVIRRGSGTEVFNVSTERAEEYVHTFDRAGQYDVKCDIHEGMEATVIVAHGPTTVVSGNDGRFSIPNVAPGSYKLSLTYAGQTVEHPVEVRAGRTEVNISR